MAPSRALVVGPVELDQRAVEARLVGGVAAATASAISPLTCADRAQHALAAERLAAVAQLDGLVLAGRRARRDRRAAERAGLEAHVDLDRGVAAAVEDLAGVDVRDRAHAHAVRLRAPSVAIRPGGAGPADEARHRLHSAVCGAGFAPKMRR